MEELAHKQEVESSKRMLKGRLLVPILQFCIPRLHDSSVVGN